MLGCLQNGFKKHAMVSYDAGLKVVDQQTAQLVCEIEVWLHFRVCVLTLAEV